MDNFREYVRGAIGETPVRQLLATKEAVVLERVAMGGGATNWYYCSNASKLDFVADRLLPGSVVSFYFDGRLSRITDFATFLRSAQELFATAGESVVAALTADECTLAVDFVSRLEDMDDFLAEHSNRSVFFAGEFPGRDNDGYNAVTFTVPDEDGVVRQYPH
jgi:hypothetical protein